jgi:hypothetical protein
MAPTITDIGRPNGPPVSIFSRKLTNSISRWLSSSSTSKKWRTFLATLSNTATRTTSKRCLPASAKSWSSSKVNCFRRGGRAFSQCEKKELRPNELIHVPCPTCGSAAGGRCELHSGAPRSEPHSERTLTAIEAAERTRIQWSEMLMIPLAPMWMESARDLEQILCIPETS